MATGLRAFVPGSKSKSCVGLLNTPPQLMLSPVTVCVAGLLMVTREGESTLTMNAPPGTPPALSLTLQNCCRMAVEGMPVITAEPAVMLPEEVNPAGPASAAKNTCPLGRMAPGASSAPNGEAIPFSVPLMSGPAAQVFVEGV